MIFLGNGLGAYIVREITVHGTNIISKFAYLKNGAMYAIAALSIIMVAGAFGHQVPEWVSPVVMLTIVGFFFLKSKKLVA